MPLGAARSSAVFHCKEDLERDPPRRVKTPGSVRTNQGAESVTMMYLYSHGRRFLACPANNGTYLSCMGDLKTQKVSNRAAYIFNDLVEKCRAVSLVRHDTWYPPDTAFCSITPCSAFRYLPWPHSSLERA